MALVTDLTDKSIRMAIAYGRHAVRANVVKHSENITGAAGSATVATSAQVALGEGPWEAMESLYIKARPLSITPPDTYFHPGDANDAPDPIFPGEPPHSYASHFSAKLPDGYTSGDLQEFFGIFKTLRTADYDTQGRQIDSNGALVPAGADPRPYYFYDPKANPARAMADQMIRWGKRLPIVINWQAWDIWRQYNAEDIDWDDGKYIPANITLIPTNVPGGTLVPGTTYYFRLLSYNATDTSRVGREWSLKLPAGANAITVNWEVQTGATPTGFRIYLSTVSLSQSVYTNIPDASSRSKTITTLSGLSSGVPPIASTAGFIRKTPRFQCHLFFIPPYDLRDSLDKIFQISCADYQWANGKMAIYGPWPKAPIFTVDASQINAFKTFTVNRRNRPNQIQVNYRNLDDEYLYQADPILIPDPATTPSTDIRIKIQQDDGQILPFVIDGGCMTRSQAERMGNFWYNWYVMMDQVVTGNLSPKSFMALPGDTIKVTNEIVGWTDVKFKLVTKEENVQSALGDPFTAQLYSDDLYSDDAHSIVERPLPKTPVNPFAAPEAVTNFAPYQFDKRGVLIKWDSVKVPGTSEVFFDIERLDGLAVDTPNGIDWQRVVSLLSSDHWTDQKYPLLDVYKYRIRAISEHGIVGPWAEATFNIVNMPAPPAPADLLFVALSRDQIEVVASRVGNDTDSGLEYIFLDIVGLNTDFEVITPLARQTSNRFIDTRKLSVLTPGTSYNYNIYVVTAWNSRKYSNPPIALGKNSGGKNFYTFLAPRLLSGKLNPLKNAHNSAKMFVALGLNEVNPSSYVKSTTFEVYDGVANTLLYSEIIDGLPDSYTVRAEVSDYTSIKVRAKLTHLLDGVLQDSAWSLYFTWLPQKAVAPSVAVVEGKSRGALVLFSGDLADPLQAYDVGITINNAPVTQRLTEGGTPRITQGGTQRLTEATGGGNVTLPGGASVAGVSGQIQFNLSGSFGADSNLFWDNVNKKLGVGLPTPQATLDILSPGTMPIRVRDTSGRDYITTNIRTSSYATVPNVIIAGRLAVDSTAPEGGNDTILRPTANSLFIDPASPSAPGVFGVRQAGGGYAIYINQAFDGNVGIGTYSPDEKLSVAGKIHSLVGGFKYPDNTVQTTAASGTAAQYNASSSRVANNVPITDAGGTLNGFVDAVRSISSSRVTVLANADNSTAVQPLKSVIIPANTLTSTNQVLRLTARGVLSTGNGQTPQAVFAIRLLNQAAWISFQTENIDAIQNATPWELEVTFSPTATGKVMIDGRLTIQRSVAYPSAASVYAASQTGGVAVDFTLQQQVFVTVQFLTNAISPNTNTCTQRLMMLEQVY